MPKLRNKMKGDEKLLKYVNSHTSYLFEYLLRKTLKDDLLKLLVQNNIAMKIDQDMGNGIKKT